MHHFAEFFKSIRRCIAEDSLPDLIKLIDDQKQKYDAEAEKRDRLKADESQKQTETNAVLKRIKINENGEGK